MSENYDNCDYTNNSSDGLAPDADSGRDWTANELNSLFNTDSFTDSNAFNELTSSSTFPNTTSSSSSMPNNAQSQYEYGLSNSTAGQYGNFNPPLDMSMYTNNQNVLFPSQNYAGSNNASNVLFSSQNYAGPNNASNAFFTPQDLGGLSSSQGAFLPSQNLGGLSSSQSAFLPSQDVAGSSSYYSSASLSSQSLAGPSLTSSASLSSQGFDGPSNSSNILFPSEDDHLDDICTLFSPRQDAAGPSNSSSAFPSSQDYAGPSNTSGAYSSPHDFAGPSTSSGAYSSPQDFAGPSTSSGAYSSPQDFAGPSNSSSSFNVESSSPGAFESTLASSPNLESGSFNEPLRYRLGPEAQAVYNRLSDSQRRSVGWSPELNRMLTDHPNFIPTFDIGSAMAMTGRDVVNPVSGSIPAATVFDHPDLVQFRNEFNDVDGTTIEQFTHACHRNINAISVRFPALAEVLKQYSYQPQVEPETLGDIFPKVAKALEQDPQLLDYYQVPLWPEDTTMYGDEDENPEPANDSDEDADDEEGEPEGTKKKKDPKKGPKKLESRFYPRAVQYSPYRYRFKTAEQARAHRRKVRQPALVAKDIDRVEKYGRYYWTKRLYEAMINIDLIFDNKASGIATNISKLKHFNEDDLEATAHHIFDACIKVHREGWCGYDYNRKDFKRGKHKDVFGDSIEKRLERICGVLKHSKATVNDCITGGDVLRQLVYNPAHRASTKAANNKGNRERAARLARQETDLQRRKREAREAEKANRDAEKERKKAERDAKKAELEAKKKAEMEAKKAEVEAKKAEREAEKKRKQREKALEKALNDAIRGHK